MIAALLLFFIHPPLESSEFQVDHPENEGLFAYPEHLVHADVAQNG